jgi:RHS repeat-associated protein
VRKQFTGYERDGEIELNFAQARIYGSCGRYTSVDPISSKIAAPQSHNRYVYVENNPLKYIDPTGETLVINGDNAGDLMAELEASTGYKLSRCAEVDKKAGCNQVGQVLVVGKLATTGISRKLADALTNVIQDLKDSKGNDVTVTLNTTKNDSGTWIDKFSSRTVDVGDLKAIRNAGGGNFVAGQLGHILAEYSGVAVNKANNPNYVDTYDNGNPKTHDAGLEMESQILSQLDGENYAPRRQGYLPNPSKDERESVYVYDGDRAKIGYTFTFDYNNKKFNFNVTNNIRLSSIPKNAQVPK